MTDISPEELDGWLQHSRDTGIPIDMSVSCPKCWLPIPLTGDIEILEEGCQCGTVATLNELRKVFGIPGMSGSFHEIRSID